MEEECPSLSLGKPGVEEKQKQREGEREGTKPELLGWRTEELLRRGGRRGLGGVSDGITTMQSLSLCSYTQRGSSSSSSSV